MKVRAQIAMVLNLDKCIGCHTCSVTCKNVWTNREGMEYAWFNNVETKPGIGYPKEWENQDRWNGGWKRKRNGKIEPRIGGKWRILANIFANPDLPEIDDYYEPFTFDYEHLQKAPELQAFPTARPRSLGCARSATRGTMCCDRLAPTPMAKLAAISTPSDGATAIANTAASSVPSIARISVRLSKRSPSGASSSTPARKPPNVSVATQPTAVTSAPNSRPNCGSSGV